MRAEKRKKNAPKELARLQNILKTNSDVLMDEVKEIATVVPVEKIKEKKDPNGKVTYLILLKGIKQWALEIVCFLKFCI